MCFQNQLKYPNTFAIKEMRPYLMNFAKDVYHVKCTSEKKQKCPSENKAIDFVESVGILSVGVL